MTTNPRIFRLLVSPALLLCAASAFAQVPTQQTCDELTAQGVDASDCEAAVRAAAQAMQGATPPSTSQSMELPPQRELGAGASIPRTTRGATTKAAAVSNYAIPTLAAGATTGKSDCDPYGDAFDVIGSFTNYAFWMTDKSGVMAERQTLHGIYIEDQSQNVQDTIARLGISTQGGDGCRNLQGTASAATQAYQQEFDLLTKALTLCAESGDQNTHAAAWKACPSAIGAALDVDDKARASGGPLDRFLQAQDGDNLRCLSGEDRAFLESMRLAPCQRGSNWAPDGNRCASSRYGLATGRIGQLGKVRGLLGRVRASSGLSPLAKAASSMVGEAQSKLSNLVSNPAQNNTVLFEADYQVFAAQKTLEAGNSLCQ